MTGMLSICHSALMLQPSLIYLGRDIPLDLPPPHVLVFAHSLVNDYPCRVGPAIDLIRAPASVAMEDLILGDEGC